MSFRHITLSGIPISAVIVALVLSTVATSVIFYHHGSSMFQQTRKLFEYRKLQGNEIRLIVIRRGQFSDPIIRCFTKHVELSQRPEYQALSYCWGENVEKKTIICDGKELQVLPNLYSALRRLRSEKEEYVLWVDAICINQGDVAERSNQVAMMGKIYSLATRVLIWLGDEEEHEGKRAFAFLRSIHDYFRARSPSYAGGGPIHQSPELLNGIQQMNLTLLRKLFDRPWFRRLWVVQEVVKAQEAILIFGTNSVPWTLLTSVLTALVVIDGGSLLSAQAGDTPTRNVRSIITTAYSQENYQLRDSVEFDIVALLFLLRSFDCSESKDKIYALLGLTWSEGLLPDYSLTTREATQRLIQWYLETNFSLRFLCLAGKSSHSAQQDLPSWLPQVSGGDFPRQVIEGNSNFNASKVPSYIATRSAMLEGIKVEDDILILSGSNFDTIKAVSQSFLPIIPEIRGLDFQTEIYIELAKLIALYLNLAHECSVQFEDEIENVRYTQFCSTISIGRWKSLPDGQNVMHTLICRVKKYLDSRDVQDLIGSNSEEFFKVFPMADFIASAIYQRCFALTGNDRFALVPKLAQLGDRIVVFKGAKVPFIVRTREDGCFTLIGECYTHGLMIGEIFESPGLDWKEFKLS